MVINTASCVSWVQPNNDELNGLSNPVLEQLALILDYFNDSGFFSILNFEILHKQ